MAEIRGWSKLTKTKYVELQEAFQANAEALRSESDTAEFLDGVMRIVRDVMHFSPDVSTYTPQQKAAIVQWRKKKVAETGQNMYTVSGSKASYLRRKVRAADACAGDVASPLKD